MTNVKGLMSGVFKFRERIQCEDLIEFAQDQLREGYNGELFKTLRIRMSGKNQLGIEFLYDYKDLDEEYKDFMERTTDKLKRTFGNDYIGYDVGTVEHVISCEGDSPSKSV